LFSSALFAQQGVSVNYQTGTASINIPIHTVHRGNVSVPVSLTYVASGVHVNDVSGAAGMGWTLNAGGAITRQLRDLPDDVKTDNSAMSRPGWIFNSAGSVINSFTIANDNNPSTCADEASDLSYISTYLSSYSDLQPDIFTISAPGLNCSFVYDNVAGVFRTIPYQDLVITYTMNAQNNGIASFTVTNDQGITYVFGQVEMTTEKAVNPGTITSYGREYVCYEDGITFADAWYLTSVMDAGGNNIILKYGNGTTFVSNTPVTSIFGSGPSSYSSTPQYTLQTTGTPQLIHCIEAWNLDYSIDSVVINHGLTFNNIYDEITSISCANGKSFSFTYAHVGGSTVRDYLVAFGEPTCETTSQYQFTYTGVNFANNTSTLPDSASFSQDYWGYYNGNTTATDIAPLLYVFPDNPSYPNLERYRLYDVPGYPGTYFMIAGTDRSANATYITAGTLSQMTTPFGGTVSFTYEPNDYYDVSAATTHIGGGIRVKQLVFYDGINSASNVTKNYTYTDPSTGITTGQPISLPQFAFTLPNSGDPGTLIFWNTATVRNALNVSNESTAILYGKVKEQQAGAGSSLYQFINPGTYWQTSASPDWTPTMVDVGAPTSGGSCPIYYTKNSTYNYPYPPNVNYEFERGLLGSVTHYNDAGNQVGQSVYTYQRSYSTPAKIPGFSYETAGTATYYSKYNLYLATSELTSTVTNYVNDIGNTTNDPSKQQVTITNYYYQSPNHKLVTKIESVNTDGSTNRQYIQYAKDFNTSTAADGPSTAIKGMVSLNQNYPIEKYWTVTRNGTELTVAAELNKYGLITPSIPQYMYLPVQRLNFVSGTGVGNFAFSSISGAGAFQNYSGYIPTANYTVYHPNGVLMTSDDTHNNSKTDLIDDDILSSVASITNASYSEMGFGSFETTGFEYQFTITGGGTTNTFGRTGLYSYAMTTGTILSRTLNLHANAKRYVFSCWLNAATAGTLTVSVYNSGGTQVTSAPIGFGINGTGQWQYYEVKLPTTSVSGSFSVKVQSSVGTNIDDILFYPENSEVTTSFHNVYSGLLLAKTNTNGVAEYYGYDNLLRLQYVYDQDKNIVVKKTYINANDLATLPSANFSHSSNLYAGQSVTFTGPANTACMPGTYYQWSFGDGGSLPSTLGNSVVNHAYSSSGTYTVTLTTTNSFYGTRVSTQNITILANLTVNICQSGVAVFNPSSPYQAITLLTCPPNPSNNTHCYFTLTGITDPSGTQAYTYQWQEQYTDGGSGSGVWFNLSPGGTGTQAVIPYTGRGFRSFEMRLVVTATNGNTGTSSALSVNPNSP